MFASALLYKHGAKRALAGCAKEPANGGPDLLAAKAMVGECVENAAKA
ncbi:hypothetical protein [Prosthecobacter sp.]